MKNSDKILARLAQVEITVAWDLKAESAAGVLQASLPLLRVPIDRLLKQLEKDSCTGGIHPEVPKSLAAVQQIWQKFSTYSCEAERTHEKMRGNTPILSDFVDVAVRYVEQGHLCDLRIEVPKFWFLE